MKRLTTSYRTTAPTQPDVAASEIDITTLSLLRGSLRSVANEMDTVLRLTAFSPIIAEGNDRASGIYDGRGGGVVAQGEDGLPLFIGNMQFTVMHVLREVAELSPGDVIVVNDPYYGGTHLMDMKFVAPFFWNGRLELFVANTGHWPDVGGAVPGGFSARATEIYQEGMRLPPIKLYDKGRLNDSLLEVMMANMRIPEERMGDLEAQLNALSRGQQRLEEVFRRYGPTLVRTGIDELADRSEAVMRANIENMPDGRYYFEDYLDNDGIVDEHLYVRLLVTVAGDQLTFDFSDSSPRCQGPLNSPATNTRTGAYIALKHFYPDLPVNEGTFRPIDFIIPENSFLNAEFPYPVSGSAAEVTQRVIDVCFGAFAQVVPDQAYAQGFSTSSNLTIGGEDPLTGRRYVLYTYLGGGYGAYSDGDGLSNGSAAQSIALVPPMEVFERNYPLRVRRYGLRPNSAGAGKFRGGYGIVLDLELLRGEARVALIGDRVSKGPSGIAGGEAGLPAVYKFVRSDGTVYVPPMKSKDQDVVLRAGDRIVIETPGGGGYGAPHLRSGDRRDRDIIDGVVTR